MYTNFAKAVCTCQAIDGAITAESSSLPKLPAGLGWHQVWRNFGGLSLEEAHRRFRECPEAYQEDFMWMGGAAFAYYFPVIDSYLRDTSDVCPGDDHQAWILAHCIKMQFTPEVEPRVQQLAGRVLDLTDFVQSNVSLFAPDDVEEQQGIADAWQELEELVQFVDRSDHG